MRRRVLLSFLFISLVSQAFAQRQWVQVRSAHFTVLTDTGDKQGKEIALRFEQMRVVFGNLFRKTRVSIPVPLQIVAFRNQGEFRRYAPLWNGKPVELAGFFQAADDRDFIALDMSSNDPYATVFHEYAHLLLHANFPKMPVWFDEGFAEYFSSLRVTGKTVEYGRVPENLSMTLQNSRWLPVLALFSTQRDSATYNERDKSSIFYAQSWLAVHYLISNQKLPEISKYLQMTQIEHKPVEEALQASFGVDAAGFEKILRDYYNGKGKLYGADAPEVDDTPMEVKKVDDLGVQAHLADLHAHSKDYEGQAMAEFQQVLEKDANNEIALRGLGYLYLRNNELDKAAELFRKASAGDSKDAHVHYLNALLMNRVALKEGGKLERPDVMVQELQTAISLEPSFADAYNLLAFALGSQRKFEPALSAQKKAIELNASFEPYQINLAQLYMHAQKWDDATAVLARLEQSPDQQTRESANQMLATLESERESASQMARLRDMKHDDITAPQWRRKADTPVPSETESTDSEPQVDTRKVIYTYGQLQSVDCSRDPVAILNVRSGAKLMKLRTENYKKLLVMGEDEFSCNWRDKKVLVNYKPGGKADGDVVTLELQAGK